MDRNKQIGTTIKQWDHDWVMYQLTISARYINKNTGEFSNLIETRSKFSDSKTLIKSELECIKRGKEDCGVRLGWEYHWELSEILIEQWIKYVESPNHKKKMLKAINK